MADSDTSKDISSNASDRTTDSVFEPESRLSDQAKETLSGAMRTEPVQDQPIEDATTTAVAPDAALATTQERLAIEGQPAKTQVERQMIETQQQGIGAAGITKVDYQTTAEPIALTTDYVEPAHVENAPPLPSATTVETERFFAPVPNNPHFQRFKEAGLLAPDAGVAGLRQVRNQISEAIGRQVDVSIVLRNGMFDTTPQILVKP